MFVVSFYDLDCEGLFKLSSRDGGTRFLKYDGNCKDHLSRVFEEFRFFTVEMHSQKTIWFYGTEENAF